MTRRGFFFWPLLALSLAGCALYGWLSERHQTKRTNDDAAAAGDVLRDAADARPSFLRRFPLEPTGLVPPSDVRWTARRYPDRPVGREDLVRHLSSRTSWIDDEDVVRVIVGYRSAGGLSKLRQKLAGTSSGGMKNGTAWTTLSRIHALASEFRVGDLVALVLDDDDVAYVDVDAAVSGSEHGPRPRRGCDAIPLGLYQVQNGPSSAARRQYDSWNPPAAASTASSPANGSEPVGPCLDDHSLRVAIVDSGVDVRHPDLPCHLPQTCIGRDFTGGGRWDAPDNDHGTHVLGTLAALPNGIGVLGMVPDPAAVCWIVAKVLDGDNQGLMSNVLEGAEWAAFQERATVINLSIAGGSYMNSAAELFDEIRAGGALVVAAAGNDGDQERSYPASYDSVVSVGSVGEDGLYADYSVRNADVDLVAPGTNAFSTVRIDSTEDNIMAAITFRSADGDEMKMAGMLTRPFHGTLDSLGGPWFECDSPRCPGSPGGHICVIEQGIAPYSSLASWCQDSGGVAAVIYHGGLNGHFNGNVSSSVTIPVIATSRSVGKLLLQRSPLSSAVIIQAQVGYAVMSGTSMSCPVASGALAALWQACPACDASDLQQCLFATALDLGEPGRDELYGHGKVQTSAALACLQGACCY